MRANKPLVHLFAAGTLVLGGATERVEAATTTTGQATPVKYTADFSSSFQLKPTAIAPAGASGSVQIKGGTISVHLSALNPGAYRLVGVRADGVRKSFGVITIADPTSSPSRQSTDNKKEASANPESVQVETDATITLPGDLIVAEVSQVMLFSGDNAVLESRVK